MEPKQAGIPSGYASETGGDSIRVASAHTAQLESEYGHVERK